MELLSRKRIVSTYDRLKLQSERTAQLPGKRFERSRWAADAAVSCPRRSLANEPCIAPTTGVGSGHTRRRVDLGSQRTRRSHSTVSTTVPKWHSNPITDCIRRNHHGFLQTSLSKMPRLGHIVVPQLLPSRHFRSRLAVSHSLTCQSLPRPTWSGYSSRTQFVVSFWMAGVHVSHLSSGKNNSPHAHCRGARETEYLQNPQLAMCASAAVIPDLWTRCLSCWSSTR
jgi:hypothetical protein